MEKEILNFQVGQNLNVDELLDAMSDHRDELKGFLLVALDKLSSRASCDGFRLDQVLHEEGQKYTLCYSYDWSAYYGCRDADDSGTEEEKIVFLYENGNVIFERDVVSLRVPDDEF